MYKKIAGRLFELQRQSGLLEEKDRSLYEYAYGLLLNRAIIYFIIAGLCIITGNWVEILAFLLPFTILRQYAGGIHLERAASCMVVSMIIVLGCGQFLAKYPTITISFVILLLIAVGIIFLLVPVDTGNKRLDDLEKKVYGRRARIILTLEFIVACSFLLTRYGMIAKGIAVAHIVLAGGLILGQAKNFFDPQVRSF